MSSGLLQILRYFLLALIWLFFLYAMRMVSLEVRRGRAERATTGGGDARTDRGPGERADVRLHLRVLEPAEHKGESFELTGDATLGRSPACSISFEDDGFASAVHVWIFRQDDELWLEDVGSTNGTFFNDDQLDGPVPLHRGDRLRIGRTVFEVGR